MPSPMPRLCEASGPPREPFEAALLALQGADESRASRRFGEHQPSTTQALKAQIIPATPAIKSKVHRKPLNAVSTLSSDVAHTMMATTIAPKTSVALNVPPFTTLLLPQPTSAGSPCPSLHFALSREGTGEP